MNIYIYSNTHIYKYLFKHNSICILYYVLYHDKGESKNHGEKKITQYITLIIS